MYVSKRRAWFYLCHQVYTKAFSEPQGFSRPNQCRSISEANSPSERVSSRSSCEHFSSMTWNAFCVDDAKIAVATHLKLVKRGRGRFQLDRLQREITTTLTTSALNESFSYSESQCYSQFSLFFRLFFICPSDGFPRLLSYGERMHTEPPTAFGKKSCIFWILQNHPEFDHLALHAMMNNSYRREWYFVAVSDLPW